MKKKLLSLALSLIMLLGVLSAFPVMASETTSVSMSALYNEEAEFAKDTTYIIGSETELGYFAKLCTDANDYFAGATVKLTANITLNTLGEGEKVEDWATNAPQNTWEPITMFKGIFDGNGKTISGIYAPESEATFNACGLFAVVGSDGAAVRNLNITNSYFSGGSYVAAVCGLVPPDFTNYGVKFENINVSSTVVEAEGDSAGGIVARITSSDRDNETNETNPICITNCTFGGSVTGNTTNVGGIIGKALVRVVITNCVNNGTVESTLPFVGTSSTASGNYAKATIGGIIGAYTNSGSGENVTLKIDNCTNKGKVFSDTIEEYAEMGGIIGYSNMPVSVKNCVNSGEVYTALAKIYTQIGGIFGFSRNANTVVEDCVNIGEISRKRAEAIKQTTFTSSNYHGGIVGWSDKKITITRCANFGKLYVEKATEEATTASNNGGVTIGGILGGATAADMTLTDCIFAGNIDATNCASAGILGLFNQSNGVLTRCVFAGTISENSGSEGTSGSVTGIRRAAFVANLNNMTGFEFVDCAYNNTVSALTTVVGKKSGSDLVFKITTNGTTETITYTANTDAADVIAKLAASGGKTANALTDLNAIMTLTAFDWANEETGWKIEQVGGTGNYLPMPASVARLVAAEKTEVEDGGVEYHGVQLGVDGTSVRFISTVDDLGRDKIGFEVIVIKDGKYATDELSDGTVYTSLTYTDKDGNGEISPNAGESDPYTVEGKYLGALVYNDLPSETGAAVTFVIKAFSETNGARTYDDTYIVALKKLETGCAVYSYQK